MSRKLKTLGLALLAVFAISAVVAQGASATDHTFTSDANNTDLTGDNVGDHIFESGSGTKIVCKDAKFTGTQNGMSADQVRATPLYSDCKLGTSDIVVPYHDNGCEYVFDSDTNDADHAAVDLDCGHTGSLTFTMPGCTLHLSDTHTTGANTVNQGLTGVRYWNDDGFMDSTDTITVNADVTGIKTEGTGTLGCPALGWNGTKTSTTYDGDAIFKGHTDNSLHSTDDHVGIRMTTP